MEVFLKLLVIVMAILPCFGKTPSISVEAIPSRVDKKMTQPLVRAEADKPYYRAIVLVLGSMVSAIDRMQRAVWLAYRNEYKEVKVLIMYGKSPWFQQEDCDLVYSDIEEGYHPGMLKKNMRAFQHIVENYRYDFLLRTNHSTFIDIGSLLKFLKTLPSKGVYSGDGPFDDAFQYSSYKDGVFVSGANTILTPEIVYSMTANQELVNWEVFNEDRAIGEYVHGVLGVPFMLSRMYFIERLTSLDPEAIKKEIRRGQKFGAYAYRIKNMKDRYARDRAAYVELLKEVYGISFSPPLYGDTTSSMTKLASVLVGRGLVARFLLAAFAVLVVGLGYTTLYSCTNIAVDWRSQTPHLA